MLERLGVSKRKDAMSSYSIWYHILYHICVKTPPGRKKARYIAPSRHTKTMQTPTVNAYGMYVLFYVGTPLPSPSSPPPAFPMLTHLHFHIPQLPSYIAAAAATTLAFAHLAGAFFAPGPIPTDLSRASGRRVCSSWGVRGGVGRSTGEGGAMRVAKGVSSDVEKRHPVEEQTQRGHFFGFGDPDHVPSILQNITTQRYLGSWIVEVCYHSINSVARLFTGGGVVLSYGRFFDSNGNDIRAVGV